MSRRDVAAEIHDDLAAFEARAQIAAKLPLKEFRAWLSDELQARRMSPRDLAESMNCAHSTIYRSMRAANTSLMMLGQISHALGFKVHLVFEPA